eukprot:TRINITY_DN3485_c0_g1_i1.p1 TRINITY_DN3485_c0_g1~~TRINITY_DN3485_c0_g1_i1.p1  ORF type:complete len:361 (-),score=60.26 TRINITY_DN3485_c0_g1_i1:442-1524(-)
MNRRPQRNGMSPPKKLLVFVNPRSGTKKALSIFKTQLEPKLKAEETQIIFTEFSGHCMDTVFHMNPQEISGIITVSGDGLIFEALNGIYKRPDWSEVLDGLIIGVVPGGSGNALSCSLSISRGLPYLEDFGLEGAISNVTSASATTQSLDLLEVHFQKDDTKVLSFIGVTIGLIADVDIGTEWMRCIGYLRAYLMVAWRILHPRCYKAKLSYLPLEIHSVTGKPIPPPRDSRIDMPSFDCSELPPGWKSETERYHMIYAENVPLLDPITLMAPHSQLNDGIIWLVLVREGMGRLDMIDWLLNTARGKHQGKPGVELIPVRAFRIEPIEPQGYLTVDGESFEFGNVQGQILPSKAKLMVDG